MAVLRMHKCRHYLTVSWPNFCIYYLVHLLSAQRTDTTKVTYLGWAHLATGHYVIMFADRNVAEPLQDRVVAIPVPARAERTAAAVVEANSLETVAAEEATMDCGCCLQVVAAAVVAVPP